MTRSIELPFTLCFCANIFAEIMHQEALVADRQKADFIANVSHELRSPLHGILASSELLKDTDCTELQHSLMEDVESCGRVLLNTIDHVLDFSNLIRSDRKNDPGAGKADDAVPNDGDDNTVASTAQQTEKGEAGQSFGHRENLLILNRPVKLDLAALCEDVVDSVYISRFFHGSANSTAQQVGSPGLIRSQTSPIVSLAIAPHDWNFVVQPGAIQRIIMNLLGNAIKYTTEGFIHVKLSIDKPRRGRRKKEAAADSSSLVKQEDSGVTIVLVVSDSGRGLSPDYIRTRLWCAFAQEDQTVHGTGLGLSITKRIVNMLSGTIDLQSTLGVGTTVTVALPLRRAAAGSHSRTGSEVQHTQGVETASAAVTAETLAMRNVGQGRKVAVFSRSSAIASDSSDSFYLTPHHKSADAKYAHKALVGYLAEWFAFDVVTPQINEVDVTTTIADVVVIDEERLADVRLPPNIPRVILKDSSYVGRLGADSETGLTDVVCAYVRRPVAPRKLERALRNVISVSGGGGTVKGLDVDSSSMQQDVGLTTDGTVKLDYRPKGDTAPAGTTTKTPISLASGGAPLVAALDSGLGTVQPIPVDHSQDATRSTRSYGDILIGEKPQLTTMGSDSTTATGGFSTAPSSVSSTSNAADSLSKASPRVLVVDDNAINLKVLSAYLCKHKIPETQLMATINGLEAVQEFIQAHLRGQPFDLVLMDLNMPVKDGFEAIQDIRAYEREVVLGSQSSLSGSPAMIVALTGLVSERDQQRAFDSGADRFFSKPFSGKQVGGLLDAWRARM
ncbi:hypothetical protein BX600DRAFT_466569, partial [Xylariales sp. PMI_506]